MIRLICVRKLYLRHRLDYLVMIVFGYPLVLYHSLILYHGDLFDDVS